MGKPHPNQSVKEVPLSQSELWRLTDQTGQYYFILYRLGQLGGEKEQKCAEAVLNGEHGREKGVRCWPDKILYWQGAETWMGQWLLGIGLLLGCPEGLCGRNDFGQPVLFNNKK